MGEVDLIIYKFFFFKKGIIVCVVVFMYEIFGLWFFLKGVGIIIK